MQRIRAARAISNYYKSIDPHTSISESLIRRLMLNGDIPTFYNGSKRLTSIEAVEKYLSDQLLNGDKNTNETPANTRE